MPSRAGVGAGTRRRALVMLTGVTLTTLLLAAAALAAISPIEPWQGTVAPGDSVTARFTVVDSFTSCFTGDAPPGLSATFEGLGLDSLPAGCAVSGTEVTMTVTADADVLPGDYAVTIIETALSGQLIDTHDWPVTVTGVASTTTTHPSTTTSLTGTTTTHSSTATSTSSTPTTSPATTTTSTVAEVVTDTTQPAAFSSSTDDGVPGATSTESDPAAETDARVWTVAPRGSMTSEKSEVLASGSARDDHPYQRNASRPAEEETALLARIALSEWLRKEMPGAIPPLITDAVLSPIVIGEHLFHSLLDGSKAMLIPIVLATLIGLLMVWRMRTEIDPKITSDLGKRTGMSSGSWDHPVTKRRKTGSEQGF